MNILLTGIGGQGIITLKKVLSYAVLKEGKFFRSSELHGLSQKGGEVLVHFRIADQEIFSPLIEKGGADLIISLDLHQASRVVDFASKKTIFIVDNSFSPFFQLKKFSQSDFLKITSPFFSKKIFILEASKICQEKLDSDVYKGTALLGFACFQKIIPLKEKSMIWALKKVFPADLFQKNKKAFLLGKTL